MNSPQKAIYDQARQLVAEQEDNFAYIEQQQAEAVRSLLTDNRPWQGQRLQQSSLSSMRSQWWPRAFRHRSAWP
jgi:hypothetical protein